MDHNWDEYTWYKAASYWGAPWNGYLSALMNFSQIGKVYDHHDPGGSYASQIILRYELGKVTVPIIEGSSIFIFGTLIDAFEFIRITLPVDAYEDMVIFECLAEDPVESVFRASLDAPEIIKFWKEPRFSYNALYDTPTGSYGAKAILPQKMIRFDELHQKYMEDEFND